jgi:hypothetical protein
MGKVWIDLSKNEKYNDHTRIYTDGSKKDIKVGYQSSIFSAKQEAIIGALQKLPTSGIRGVIFTDSLSTMMAASGNNHTKNPKTKKIRQWMNEKEI